MIKSGKEIKYWGQILLQPLYSLSFLMPRSKKIWALGSTFGSRFADNPKYFYLYLNQYQSNHIKAIWISKNHEVIRLLQDNDLEGYYLYSLKGIWYSLRAGIYLYDNYSKDICFSLSGGAVKINLWHGIPLKKIQMDNVFDYVRYPRTSREKFRWMLRRKSDEKPSDYIVSTSEFLNPIFSSAFRTDKVIVCGYPRNDNLISEKIINVFSQQEKDMLKLLEEKKLNHKMIFYMPTFRESEIKFFDVISLERLQDFLEQENMIFCIKLHPKSKLQERFQKVAGNNILVMDPKADPYPFLNLADILVTDYSSIYFDFLLTEKPIVFFAYDLREYLRDSRELYFDYEEFTPGVKVYYQSELESALIEGYRDKSRMEEIRLKVFGKNNRFASEHLYYLIESLADREFP